MNILARLKKLNAKPEPVLETVSMSRSELKQAEPPKIKTRDEVLARVFTGEQPAVNIANSAYDTYTGISSSSAYSGVPIEALDYFSSFGTYIGISELTVLSTHWLIQAACSVPVEDSLRNGWEICPNDGKEINEQLSALIKRFCKKIKLQQALTNHMTNARKFGISIAIPVCEWEESADPHTPAWEQPFNVDGIKPGTFKGWVFPQFGRFILPQPTGANFTTSDSSDFYEPEFWYCTGGKKYHKSQLVIFRHCEVPQVLKPTYLYGGISLTQQIWERVYQFDNALNEVQALLQTKRLKVIKGDAANFYMNECEQRQKLAMMSSLADNHGFLFIDRDEETQLLETALSEVTNIIGQKAEQVAAVARYSVNKLLAQPLAGGLNTGNDGAGERTNNETCRTLFVNGAEELIERTIQIMFKSIGIPEFDFDVVQNPLQDLSALEIAQVNNLNSQTDTALYNAGAVGAEQILQRIIKDKHSGYSGIEAELPPEQDFTFEPEQKDNQWLNN